MQDGCKHISYNNITVNEVVSYRIVGAKRVIGRMSCVTHWDQSTTAVTFDELLI